MLPSEDLGLGPLVSLGTELDFGAGPLDLLAADPQGRIVIVEFKRGTENPDVRKVVAQVLDYGASLWRTSYDEVGMRCAGADGAAAPDLTAIAAAGCARIDVPFDPDASKLVSRRCLTAESSCSSTSPGTSTSGPGGS